MSMTMSELAAKTGIPRVTISRVLNGFKYVSEETKSRVYAAIEENGYEPNLLARSLVLQKSNLLAFVVPDIHLSFYSEMIDLVEQGAMAGGMHLLPFNSLFDPAREQRILSVASQLRVDGMILVPVKTGDTMANATSLKSVRHKLVIFDYHEAASHTTVGMDNWKAGYLAVERLRQLGHRRIAMLEGGLAEESKVQSARGRGFRAAVQELGLSPAQCPVFSGPWGKRGEYFEYGYELTRSHMADFRRLGVTALFAFTDGVALGAMRALMEAGLRVPDDLSIVGCDDLDFAAFLAPPLTTIRQPREAMAAGLLAGLNADRISHTKFDPIFVERGSSAPPRKGKG